MTELGKLPMRVQEEVLGILSLDDTSPIEIDSEVYYIPNAVNDLIEFLYERLYQDGKSISINGANGISNNKK